MKLPFSVILNPVIKPYLGETRQFCKHRTFALSNFYTYFYGTVGFFVNLNYVRKHLGELPDEGSDGKRSSLSKDFMLVHDLKIIATSMSAVQYACLLVGCFTKNPALFLPHLTGQLIMLLVKVFNIFLLLLVEFDSWRELGDKAFDMETESNTLMDNIRLKHEANFNEMGGEASEGLRMRVRTLLVALLGVSMSACAFASQPVELELDDEDVAQKLSNVSFARRLTKPTIRLVMGYGKLSAFITATSSLLLLIAVMSKQSWWRRGVRWLAAPALLVAALEAASDTGDALLAAALRGSTEPGRVAVQTAAAGLLVTVEILVWYFIAKFFEYNPPLSNGELEKENLMKALPQQQS